MNSRSILFLLIGLLMTGLVHARTATLKVLNQYEAPVASFKIDTTTYTTTDDGTVTIEFNNEDSVLISGDELPAQKIAVSQILSGQIEVQKKFTWKDLLNPMFYIEYGGLWFLLFVVFAETGLFAGFFLPGDSLLFVAGIFSNNLVASIGLKTPSDFVNLLILGLLIAGAGIIGNSVGYWFGKKSGPFLYQRKDSLLFKKKYLLQAKEFYDQKGGFAIIMARFLPIVRTFAPIVAGIVGMNKGKFTYYNIVGSLAWAISMTFAGHYLQQLFLGQFNFDLKKHLEIIVIGIVFVTTAPVLFKLIFGKLKSSGETTNPSE
jgi:membrane-associated protein